MDKRQKRSRDAIYAAFNELLLEREYAQISVADIIRRAGVGRTTFYAHFPTKDALLDDVCDAIFEHVFNTPPTPEDGHDFSAGAADLRSQVAHLLHHIAENDLGVADLLRSKSSDVVIGRFQRRLYDLASARIRAGEPSATAPEGVPRSFLSHHFAVSVIGTIHWWVMHGLEESPEHMADYFVKVMRSTPCAL